MIAFRHSFAAAYSSLSAWADLLDRINVFPVADGDTGTNLRISLAPLRGQGEDIEKTCALLARCATGNSGNIAAAFFREFCRAESFATLPAQAALGRDKAWQAVASPCAGTMLTVFDSLVEGLQASSDPQTLYAPLGLILQKSVLATTQLLPDLTKAGVVDSGALAMYVFFDGFFRHLTAQNETASSIMDLFSGRLAISSTFLQEATDQYCVDVVIQLNEMQMAERKRTENQPLARNDLASLGESVVVVQDESILKVHIHTPDPDKLRQELGAFGEIIQWTDTTMHQSALTAVPTPGVKPLLHIVTDAAGSLSREMAHHLGITLLDSYIVMGDDSRPESLYSSAEIYPQLRKGVKITTAQASNYERHQHYQSICRQFGPSLYLCVGAAFTGNYDAAMAWKKENELGQQLAVLNTGAASGRLAVIAILTARFATACHSAAEIIALAQKLMDECREFVFIHELKYLVAGGRVTKAKGFFADLLHMKPVVSPTLTGVKKVGVARNSKGQLAFAMEKLAERYDRSENPLVLLQYSDNKPWVSTTILPQIKSFLPEAEILLVPLSLTSGVHMGPGTWSMAFASLPVQRTAGPAR